MYTLMPPQLPASTPPRAWHLKIPTTGSWPGTDIVAVSNTLPFVVAPSGPACTAFGGFTVGTITEFDRLSLQSGYNDDAVPFQPSTVIGINEFQIINHNKIGTKGRSKFPDTLLCSATQDSTNYECFGPPYAQNVTIGGCNTFLLGPVGLAFDEYGYLYAANDAEAVGIPKFVTVYAPFSYGDLYPLAIIGLVPANSGRFD